MSGDPSEIFTFSDDQAPTTTAIDPSVLEEQRVQYLAQKLRSFFFDASQITIDDESVKFSDGNLYASRHGDIIDTSGGGMPPQFWVHYARLMLS